MPGPPQQNVAGIDVVQLAEKIVAARVPYVLGGTSMSGFDCSGLVQYLWAKAGVNLPRTSEEQSRAGVAVTRDQLQPGDLIFSQWPGDDASPGHVAIYAGGGNLIEAPHTGEDVHQIPFNASYEAHVTGYRRVTGGGSIDWTSVGLNAATGGLYGATGGSNGLFSIPGDIVGFFSKATDDLTSLGQWFGAFTRPSTWVRVGAGAFGALALLFGLVFLMREARE